MGIKRIIRCDVCGKEEEEQSQDRGWDGWGAVQGVSLDGVNNPNACPSCLHEIMEFVESMKNGLE